MRSKGQIRRFQWFSKTEYSAISRDILAQAMRALRERDIVGHVHDELIIEADRDASVQAICELMGRTPEWIPGLTLRADGYECETYRKD